MNTKLDQLLSKVNQHKEAQKQKTKVLSIKFEKMLEDVWDLSRYMTDTFGDKAVPMPVSLQDGTPFCIYPTGEFKSLRTGAAAYYIHCWNPEDKSHQDFTPSIYDSYSYFATKGWLFDLKSTQPNYDKEHSLFVREALSELLIHWEDKYKQETEDLVAKLMEEYLEENEDRPQGLSM